MNDVCAKKLQDFQKTCYFMFFCQNNLSDRKVFLNILSQRKFVDYVFVTTQPFDRAINENNIK